MLIGRHSFIRQNKLSDVAGRIDYISNPKRQEHLYATYGILETAHYYTMER
ncbi:hypothetical protein [Dorea sp. BIOML-A1]|uniref:hypothetical protein n=1 Tax=Dorea sp. BIOML-A1 TaxID=2584637 RepID=UPI0013A88C9C|nr:hypothetical protein [Dorea sp. BIOML-A1]MZK44804.1 hypothetical protein [Dorea sp. BIOML-A1]